MIRDNARAFPFRRREIGEGGGLLSVGLLGAWSTSQCMGGDETGGVLSIVDALHKLERQRAYGTAYTNDTYRSQSSSKQVDSTTRVSSLGQ